MDILTKLVGLKHVTTDNEILYLKSWEDLDITKVKQILNDQNLYLTHEVNKYNIQTTFLDTHK